MNLSFFAFLLTSSIFLYPFLSFLVAIYFVIAGHFRSKNNKLLNENNQKWLNYFKYFYDHAQSSDETKAYQKIIDDLNRNGYSFNDQVTQVQGSESIANPINPLKQSNTTQSQPLAVNSNSSKTKALNIKLDNSEILLYFGAFLFITAVSLFVIFSGLSGILKSLNVLVVTILFYYLGLYWYKNVNRLKSPGLTFVGIGVVLAPLVGLAVYKYLFNSHYGAVVWLLTSVFCLILYIKALIVTKKSILSYLLIFTFLSLFESAIALLKLPIYYFAWGLDAVAILTQIINIKTKIWHDYNNPSDIAAQVMIGLSIIASIAIGAQHSYYDLAISLLLSSLFWFIEYRTSLNSNLQAFYAILSQLAFNIAAFFLGYGTHHNFNQALHYVLVSVLVDFLVLVLFNLPINLKAKQWLVYSVSLTTLVTSIFSLFDKPALFMSLVALTIISFGLWFRTKKPVVYFLAILSFIGLDYSYLVSYLARPNDLIIWLLALLSLVIVYVVYSYFYTQEKTNQDWHDFNELALVIGSILLLAFSYIFLGSYSVYFAGLVVIALQIAYSNINKNLLNLSSIGMVFLALFILLFNHSSFYLELSALSAVIVLSSLAFYYRTEILRWQATIAWLVLPLLLYKSHFIIHWTLSTLAYSYLLVVVAFVIARAIARGIILFSSNKKLAAYAQNKSLSYVAGYLTASVLALVISLFSADSRLTTSIVLLTYIIMDSLLAYKIEKNSRILQLIPILIQALLLSLVHPSSLIKTANLDYYLGLAGLVNLIIYLVYKKLDIQYEKLRQYGWLISTIIAFYIPVISYIFVRQSNILFPLSMLLAGLLGLLATLRLPQIAVKEWSIISLALALMWMLSILYTLSIAYYGQILALAWAAMAYNRYYYKQIDASNSYLWLMSVFALGPIAFQALANDPTGLYGWWLILEAVFLMLIGRFINRRFVIYFGLFTAFAAVLYQLRHLSYIALALLALFVIAMAVYRFNKTNIKL